MKYLTKAQAKEVEAFKRLVEYFGVTYNSTQLVQNKRTNRWYVYIHYTNKPGISLKRYVADYGTSQGALNCVVKIDGAIRNILQSTN